MFGSMSSDLAEVLEISSPADEVPVYLFATGDFPEQDRDRIVADRAYSEWYDETLSAALTKAQGGLVDALVERGYMVDYVVPEAPMVHAVLLRDDVVALARDLRIAAIDPDVGLGAPTSDGDWVYAMGLDAPHDWGWNGTNQRIGIIMTEQPLASDVIANKIQVAGTASPSGVERAEATRIVGTARSLSAGMPQGFPSRYRGSAPDSRTYVANLDGWSGVGTVDKWAYDQGCRVLVYGRASSEPYFSTFSAHDRYVDYVTRQWSCASGCVHYIGSAGNRNTLRDPWTTCGSTSAIVQNRFYNGLIVGGSDPATRTTWAMDDTMFMCPSQPALVASSWQNPSSGRELPLVTAQAADVFAGGAEFSGTSASASIVGGLVADILERSSTLRSWPEAVRAIVMATAWSDADGNSLVLADALDDPDGAGIISGVRAVDLSSSTLQSPTGPSGRGWHVDSVSAADFSGGWYNAYTPSVQVPNGSTVRVSLAWAATATCTNPNDPSTCLDPLLDCNLNLYLQAQGGAMLASSVSSVDGYEFISYQNNSGVAQTYTIAISITGGFRGIGTNLGLAWDTANPSGFFLSDMCNTTSMVNRNTDSSTINKRGMGAVAALWNTDYAGAWVRMVYQAAGSLQLQLFSRDGLPKLDSPLELSPAALDDRSIWPRMTALDEDRVVVAWERLRNQLPNGSGGWCNNVEVRVLERGNNVGFAGFSLEEGCDEGRVKNYYEPDVAAYVPPAHGTPLYWVVWNQLNQDLSHDITARRCSVGSSAMNCSADFQVAPFTPSAGWEPFPSVGTFGFTSAYPGGALVAWVDPWTGDVFGRCYRANTTLLNSFTIATQTARDERVSVTSFGDSTVVVAWIDGNLNVRYKRYSVDAQAGCVQAEAEQLACINGSNVSPWGCGAAESGVSDVGNHTRISVATNGNAANPQLRFGYARGSGSSRVFAVRRIDPGAANPWVSHVDGLSGLFDYGNESVEGGGAIAMRPECGQDWFALWGACTGSMCASGTSLRVDFTTRPW